MSPYVAMLLTVANADGKQKTVPLEMTLPGENIGATERILGVTERILGVTERILGVTERILGVYSTVAQPEQIIYCRFFVVDLLTERFCALFHSPPCRV